MPTFLGESQIRAAVNAADVLDSQARAYDLVGDPSLTSAHGHRFAPDQHLLFLHGARLPEGTTVFKTGVQRPPGLPGQGPGAVEPVQASVTVHRGSDGLLTHVLDGNTVTALRTAGGLLLALQRAQTASARTLGILGSGRTARELYLLATELGTWGQIRIWSPRIAATPGPWPSSARAASAEDLCRSADTIACCTSSTTPVLAAQWLRPEATVGTVGSYTPERSEIGDDLNALASLIAADAPAALSQVGPLVAGVAAGHFTAAQVVGFAQLGNQPRPEGRAVVHCSGLGLQDATLAAMIVSRQHPEGR